MRNSPSLAALTALLILAGCQKDAEPVTDDTDATAALAAINAEDILRHTQVLASDSFEGRAPGSPGEVRTVRYLTDQFKALGLAPGNPDGTWTQDVPLVGITAQPTGSFTVGAQTIALDYPADYVANTRRVVPEVRVDNSDIVFVGYGVVAPEYFWDDYKGVDVKGKTVVMLINDPAIMSVTDPTVYDSTRFRGKAMTYYGRWTYKYEIGMEKGAAAVVIVHETGPAGYPYEVIGGGWSQERFDTKSADNNMKRVAVESWITDTKARELFSAAGLSFDSLKTAATRNDFKPVTLNAKANFVIRNEIREIASKNVVAKVEGAEIKDEYVIYSAHWDHLGKDSTLQGDQIFNGALDNATGTAALLELAQAFSKQEPKPKRSILFIALTAEEQGLLGAKHYALNPLYPLKKTLANINMDGVNQWGRTSDLVVIGMGNSTLEDILQEVAAVRQRTLVPDPESEKGYYYRSDHFEFAKEGVPALYTDAGTAYIGKDAAFGQQKRDEYTNNDYHKVSDEVKHNWDLSGAAEDLKLLYVVGLRVAQSVTWPEWKVGTEFRAKREAMLKK